tara:strand:- start:54 stop:440 length:387 start_codon:yes stop_codon:yes gene_type:complete
MDFTNYLADRLVKATVGNVAWTTPEKVYLALYTADPTKAGFSSNEVLAPSYNRQEITFTPPLDGVSVNASQIDFNTATSNWGNVGWVSITDSSSGGFMLYFAGLDDPKTILSGDQFKIDAGKLQLTLT